MIRALKTICTEYARGKNLDKQIANYQQKNAIFSKPYDQRSTIGQAITDGINTRERLRSYQQELSEITKERISNLK